MLKFTRSLGFRLFSLLLMLGILVFVSLTVFIVRFHTNHLMDEIVNGAIRANDLIEGSIHYSMLQNRKEDVAQIIRTLGHGPEVEGIRIYNRLGKIVFSTNEKEVGESADLKAEQCVVCHSGPKPLESIPKETRPRIIESPLGYRVLAVMNPIRNEAGCGVPGCHPPPSEQKILGIMDAKMSLALVDANIRASRNRMIFYSIAAILLIEVFAGLFIWRMVHRRVVELSEGTRLVMNGNLEFALDGAGKDELASLARSFNRMVADLNAARKKNEELSQTMIHVAKMASMGKLAATVAHEINNPLEGILTYMRLLQKQVCAGPLSESDRDACSQQMETVISEVKRCGAIVKNMLHFSKSPASLSEKVNIHEIIEKSLSIVNHHLEISEIAAVKNFGANYPVIVGNANQLQQMLICLFINAVEAMSNSGTLTVSTSDVNEAHAILIEVADNGKGIPKELRSRIFEPFFTTKEDAHGVGLGLSVVYGIVTGHQGTITLDSTPGRGTTFSITLPRAKAPIEERPKT